MYVDYIKDKNIFRIHASYEERFRCSQLPCRDWDKKTKTWKAVNVSLNRDTIKTWSSATFSESAKEALRAEKSLIQTGKEFPSDFKFKTSPYEHQEMSCKYVYQRKVSCLFAEMGLGKTKISLDVMAQHYIEETIDTVIVFCPASIVSVWHEEVAVHCPVDVKTIKVQSTAKFKKEMAYLDSKRDESKYLEVIVVSTESNSTASSFAHQFVKDRLKGRKYGVIIDEAHFIKNSNSQRSSNLKKLCIHASVKLIMTGTPFESNLLNLYSYFDFLDPDIIGIGSERAFKNRYLIYNGFILLGTKNVDELKEKTSPFILTIRKKDVLDIPDKVYTSYQIEMTPQQKKIYMEVKKQKIIDIKKELQGQETDSRLKFTHVLSLLTGLQKLASGYYTDTELLDENFEPIKKECRLFPVAKNPKVKQLKDVVSSIPNEEPIIIWAKYLQEIEDIKESLAKHEVDAFKFPYVTFTGKQTSSEKQENKDLFREGKAKYFIATQSSGGTGLTLNNSKYVIYYSSSFSFLHRAQSEDRNHRIGQKNSVTYIDLLMKDTIETRIHNLLKEKKGFSDYLLDELGKGNIEKVLDTI